MKAVIMGLLRLMARLPLGVLYLFSDIIYPIVCYVVGYRRKVVDKNLAEAFPEKTEAEIKKIGRQYYRFMCDTIVETVKLLHISDAEMRRRVTVENPGIVSEAVSEGKSAVLLLAHYGNWEWVQEISRDFAAGDARMYSIYHPLKSRMWDEIYARIRSRWHVAIIPQLQAVRTLLAPGNRPWICGFIADNRPDTFNHENVIPFLNHYTSFIYGPELIGRKVGAAYFFLEMERTRRGYYTIRFHRLEPAADVLRQTYPHIRLFWMELEKVIKRKPAYWLWSHKRWKRDRVIN